MALSIHLGHHRTVQTAADEPRFDPRVFAVQRAGAVIVGLVLLGFGLVGFTRGVPALSSHGEQVLGLSADGVLAGLSVVVAAVLIGAAMRGPRVASTVMLALGALFLLSALVNLAVMGTRANLLAFETSNVIFSVVVGLLLLTLGSYGRFSGHLPANSPYAHPHPSTFEPSDLPSTPAEFAAEAAMRQAEIAVVEHRATEDQRRRVRAMARVHTRDERRRVWMSFDRPSSSRSRAA
jgi:Domain of unknown function (DUF4383)